MYQPAKHRSNPISHRMQQSGMASKRCLQLYQHGCMSLVTKNYTTDLNQQQRQTNEMAQCSFRPSICPLTSPQIPFPQPTSFDTTILRLRRGRELRTRRSDLLAPRKPMSLRHKPIDPANGFQKCDSVLEPVSKKDSVVLVEVTKDCENGGVLPVGILRVRMKDNIEELAYKFGRDNLLSTKQAMRLYEQLQIALNTLSNSQ